jgi:predicted SprT family Zn-dependent metalloprotease
MQIKTADKICKRLSCQYGIINAPEVIPLKYSRIGKSVILGYYNKPENKIEINKYALEQWTPKQISEIITHELMHARCYQDFGHGGHGKRFHILCDLFGIGAEIKRATKKDNTT